MKRYVKRFKSLVATSLFVVLFSSFGLAQSRDQNFPTPLTSNELNVSIKARDIGDSRLTTYYYLFGGSVGDVFVNVVSMNFAGDIDIFTQDGLRLLSKIVIFADANSAETGRLIYLRKEESILLRIQGRTPNDDPSTFRIRFGGTFIALKERKLDQAPILDPQPSQDGTNVAVNSVGTKIPGNEKTQSRIRPNSVSIDPKPSSEATGEKGLLKKADPAGVAAKPKPEGQTTSIRTTTTKKPSDRTVSQARTSSKPEKTSTVIEEKKIDPLANVRLTIKLKKGTVIELPMNQVQKFGVDKGILTVININGTISKFSLVEVDRVTIQ